MTKSLIITGANGFIGEELVKHFYDRAWNIKALIHSSPANKLQGVEYVHYNIEEQINEALFDGADYLIHCSYLRYEKNKNSDQLNVNGTKALIDSCRKKNIKPVFLSSFSAHEAAVSHYGKTKLECEKLFDPSKDLIFKTGFVIGHKGLSGEIINRIRQSKFFPLVGGGSQPIQTIAIDDLCLLIEKALNDNIFGSFHAGEHEAVSLKMFYREIATQLNKKIVFVPVPLSLLYIVCKLSESIGLKLPVSSENVLGLKHLIKFDTREDLKKLGASLKDYRESLRSVLK